ncbi:hypothetical protein PMIN06_003549 [Paraphaeosphaeria minitans]
MAAVVSSLTSTAPAALPSASAAVASLASVEAATTFDDYTNIRLFCSSLCLLYHNTPSAAEAFNRLGGSVTHEAVAPV